MESKSPRTDAEIKEVWKGVPAAYVRESFARLLEEELNDAKEEIAELRKYIPDYIVHRRV